jgi:tetratricopeptide (TPR) repeat protein
MTDTRAQLGDAAFDAAWSRIHMMMRSPEQFSTLFVFNGNDLRKQALFARLTQASQAQGCSVLWPITRALSEVLEPWNPQTPSVVDALIPRILQLSLEAEPEKPAGTEAHSATPPLGLLVLELDDSLPRRLRDAFWPQDASFDQARPLAEPLRMALLSRLNERRESLARRAPLLIVLPKTWTRNAALCAPDLWSVRLTSLYLQSAAPTTDAHTETPVPRPLQPVVAPETTGTLTAAHHRILRQWVQAIDTGQTHHLVTSDGWDAVQTSLLLGDSTQALRLANAVLELAYQRDHLRDQMVSQGWLGNVYLRLGQLDEALDAYQIAHMLAQQLATNDPQNSRRQRDLSVSYENLADILAAQGEYEQALAQYTQSLAIREKLVASDPKNSDWQRDLSVSFNKVAGILEAHGERELALGLYTQSLAIREKLAASDPKNSDWQHDLSVSFDKVAGILEAKGEHEQALALYTQSLTIFEKLAASDPKNSDWQHDLSVSFDRVAGILAAQGEREQALAQYTQGLAISEKLAASDPKNAQWQIDWVVSLVGLARVAPTTTVRNARYDQALALLQTLNAKGLLSAQQKNWISVIENEKAA